MADDLCATCRDPGHCCRAFYLATMEGGAHVRPGATREEAQAQMDAKGWPFVPVKHAPFDFEGETIDDWLFTCPKLPAGGRCSIHEDRPQLCRDFKAGSDPLCVYFDGGALG